MVKIKWLLCGLILSTGPAATAQLGFGAAGGVTRASLNATGWPDSELQPGSGWLVALPVEYRLSPGRISLAATPQYWVENYTLRRSGQLAGIEENFRSGYLQLPVTARVGWGSKWRWFIGAGAYIAWWSDGRLKGRIPDIFSARDISSGNGQPTEQLKLTAYDTRYSFDSRKDRRLIPGWALEAGGKYALTRQYGILLQGNYFQAFTSQEKHYSGGSGPLNRTLGLSIGVFWQPSI